MAFPAFFPSAVRQLQDPAAIALARSAQRAAVPTPLHPQPLPTAFARWGEGSGSEPPLLLLHGFDSSLLEFYRLMPELAPLGERWALDLVGFGFTARWPQLPYGLAALKAHLHAFWQARIGQPVVAVGASMGGAAALDWALSYPHAVRAVVALDSVGYSGNFAIGLWLLPPLDGLAVAFWRQRKLQAQFWAERTGVLDPAALEVLRCFSLPLAMPGWHEALRRFTRSGGYTHLAPHIPQLSQPALIVWGEQDRTLGDAERFHWAIARAQLARIPGAGHAPHLDRPQAVARAIQAFARSLAAASSTSP